MKTIIVTGANNGIGFATTMALVKQGHNVLMICRNQARADAAIEKISAETQTTPELYMADLSLQADIVKVAHEIKRKHDHIDVLINNAGTAFFKRQETSEGIENTWALNHLGTMRLTLELLPLLIASAPARVVTVASSAADRAKLNLADPEGKKKYKAFPAYAQSKLANIMFTYELARRLKGTGVTATAHNPGAVYTERSNSGWLMLTVGKLFRPFMRTLEQGAQNSVYLAVSPEIEGETGIYLEKDGERAKSAESTYDQTLTKQLWDQSIAQMGINDLQL